MSDNGFVNQHADNVLHFYRNALLQFNFTKKYYGTQVVVNRPIKGSDGEEVFGSIYSSTIANDDEYEYFNYVIVINMNNMKNIYLKTIEQVEIFDNEAVLKKGDTLTFTRGNYEYKFIIKEHYTYSEAGGVINKYLLSGFRERNAKE